MNKSEFEAWIGKYKNESKTYAPDIEDLYSLYTHVRKYRITSILEIGSGWSTLALSQALVENKSDFESEYLRNNPSRDTFRMVTLDASAFYLETSLSRLDETQKLIVKSYVSSPKMDRVSGRACHTFENFPNFSADLIYLDGPDCDQVTGDTNGSSVNPNYSDGGTRLPMSADLIKTEFFIEPGSWIIVDGRGANAEFLRLSFVRNWNYEYKKTLDQHFFRLDSDSWGSRNESHKNR